MKISLDRPLIKGLVIEAEDQGELESVTQITKALLEHADDTRDRSQLDWDTTEHDRTATLAKEISLAIVESIDPAIYEFKSIELSATGSFVEYDILPDPE